MALRGGPWGEGASLMSRARETEASNGIGVRRWCDGFPTCPVDYTEPLLPVYGWAQGDAQDMEGAG